MWGTRDKNVSRDKVAVDPQYWASMNTKKHRPSLENEQHGLLFYCIDFILLNISTISKQRLELRKFSNMKNLDVYNNMYQIIEFLICAVTIPA